MAFNIDLLFCGKINHCNQSNRYDYDYHIYAFKVIILKVAKFCFKFSMTCSMIFLREKISWNFTSLAQRGERFPVVDAEK